MNESNKIIWLIESITKGRYGFDLGCGSSKIPGSIGIDIKPDNKPDMVIDCCVPEAWTEIKATYPYDSEYDYIYSSHLIEDFDEQEQIRICKLWLENMAPDGFLILYVPEKGAYKGTNFDHKREFEKGFMEKLFKDIGIKEFIVSYESNWSETLYGILGIGKKGT